MRKNSNGKKQKMKREGRRMHIPRRELKKELPCFPEQGQKVANAGRSHTAIDSQTTSVQMPDQPGISAACSDKLQQSGREQELDVKCC